MSYILDALRKSEQDRTPTGVPQVTRAPLPGRPRARRWTWPLLALLVLNGMLVGALLLRDAPAPTRPAGAPPGLAELPAPAPALAQAREAPGAAPAPTPEPAPAPEAPTPEPEAPKPAPEPKPTAVKATPSPAPAPSVAKPSPPAPEPAATADYGDLPLWRALGAAQRHGLPALSLDVHAYASRPPQRFVLINLKRYGEGDTLDEGPRVEAITPEGVVLAYRGERFRLSAR